MFELQLRIVFAREIIFIEPPAPLSPMTASVLQTDLGRILFYFDRWESRGDNLPGDPNSGYQSIFVHFIPDNVPDAVERLFDINSIEFKDGIAYSEDIPEIKELEERVMFAPFPEPPDHRAKRRQAWVDLEEYRSRLLQRSAEVCAHVLTQREVASYFEAMSKTLQDAVYRFLEILRIQYHQHLIPDRPFINWLKGAWLVGSEIERFKEYAEEANDYAFRVEYAHEILTAFLNQLFPTKLESGIVQAIKPSAWAGITNSIQSGDEPALSEVLIATAFGLCDPELGNPRLALIESVIALEIEVKKLMQAALKKYRISNNAIDRIVRETALADLVSVWIRREIWKGDEAEVSDLYEKCARAIHERNELVHRERRKISNERAREYINAISKLVEKARQIRQSI